MAGEDGSRTYVQSRCVRVQSVPSRESEARDVLKGSSRISNSGRVKRLRMILARLVCPFERVTSGSSRNPSISNALAVSYTLSPLASSPSLLKSDSVRCSLKVNLSPSRI